AASRSPESPRRGARRDGSLEGWLLSLAVFRPGGVIHQNTGSRRPENGRGARRCFRLGGEVVPRMKIGLARPLGGRAAQRVARGVRRPEAGGGRWTPRRGVGAGRRVTPVATTSERPSRAAASAERQRVGAHAGDGARGADEGRARA